MENPWGLYPNPDSQPIPYFLVNRYVYPLCHFKRNRQAISHRLCDFTCFGPAIHFESEVISILKDYRIPPF